MSGQRVPKRPHPDKMCYQCEHWTHKVLDWGYCIWRNINDDIIIEDLKYAYEKACGMGWSDDWF